MNRKLPTMVVVAALSMASCGGATSLSTVELAKRGNEICAARAAAIKAAMAGQRSYRKGVERAMPALSKSVSELVALKPPSSLKASYARFLSEERAQLAQLRAGLAGQRIRRTEHPVHEHGRLRRELGLTACV